MRRRAVFRAALGGGADVVFGAVDGDGDVDLFAAHPRGNNHLLLRRGAATGRAAGHAAQQSGRVPVRDLADLDADGDLDLVLAAFWGGSRVLANPRRQ
jgi:hypothetical protein